MSKSPAVAHRPPPSPPPAKAKAPAAAPVKAKPPASAPDKAKAKAKAAAPPDAFAPPTPSKVAVSASTQTGAQVQERRAEALAGQQLKVKKAFEQLPPSAKDTTLKVDAGAGVVANAKTATAALKKDVASLLGPGDPKGLQKYLDDNTPGLELTAIAAQGGLGKDASLTETDFYGLAINGLRKEIPSGDFRLVLSAARDGGSPSQPLIAVDDRSKAGAAPRFFALDTGTLSGQRSDVRAEKVLERAGLTEAWYRSFSQSKVARVLDRGNAEKTVRALPPAELFAPVRRLSPQQQQQFFAAYQAEAGVPVGQYSRGGLLTEKQPPRSFLASVEANHLGTGAPPPSTLKATVSVDGAREARRTAGFVENNYQTLTTAALAPALLKGAPRALPGSHLANEVGTALGLEPDRIPKSDADWAKVGQGEWSFFGGANAARVDGLAGKIRSVGGEGATVGVVPVLHDSRGADDSGLHQLPVFRVQRTDGQVRFVDESGRTYDSVHDWRENNQLPRGRITYPADLEVAETAAGSGQVKAVTERTNASRPSNLDRAKQVLDGVALVGGVVLGGAAIVGTGGTGAVVAGGLIGAYGAARAAERLEDRADHGQSINPFSSADARGAWLDFGANALSVATLGSSTALGAAARVDGEVGAIRAFAAATSSSRGVRVLEGATRALSVGSEAANAAALGNTVAGVAARWDELSGSERAKAVLQLGYWGASSAVGARRLYDAEGTRAVLEGGDGRAVDGPGAEAATVQGRLFGRREASVVLDHAGIAAHGPEFRQRVAEVLQRLPQESRGTLERTFRDVNAGQAETIGQALAHPAFRALPDSAQAELVTYLSRELGTRRPGLEQLGKVLRTSEGRPLDEQVGMLSSLATRQPFLPLHDVPGQPLSPRQKLTVEYAAPGTKRSSVNLSTGAVREVATGDKVTVFTVRTETGHTIEVVRPNVPAKSGARYPTERELVDTLAGQPQGALEYTDRIILTARPAYDPDHAPGLGADRVTGAATGRNRFVDAGGISRLRSGLGRQGIELKAVYDAESVYATLTHEVAHGREHGLTPSDVAAYEQAIASDRTRVSNYGATNASEDFAEGQVLYLQVLGTAQEAYARSLYPNRFAFYDRVRASEQALFDAARRVSA